jgi:hypothetical protein
MANKTQLNDACVHTFLAEVEHPVRRQNAQQVTAIMRNITSIEPHMWGDMPTAKQVRGLYWAYRHANKH